MVDANGSVCDVWITVTAEALFMAWIKHCAVMNKNKK